MVSQGLAAFALLWGIWILVPILVDMTKALRLLLFSLRRQRRPTDPSPDADHPPLVSVLIPCHNAAAVLGGCIDSVAAQTYPLDRLEVLVVDNASTDGTAEVFHRVRARLPQLRAQLVVTSRPGKAMALNAGIHATDGRYVCNIDADVQLQPGALRAIVEAFERDPALAAATGAVVVARPAWPPRGRFLRFLQACERLEYLVAFRVGRHHEDATNTLFTLAGAFSFFRRDILLGTFLYTGDTVSEDTELTFDIRAQALPRGMRIGCIPEAVALTQPTPGLGALYAQRARWQRGQIEVAALQPELRRAGAGLGVGGFLGRTLLVDHTLAFPRLVWTFLLPGLYWLGYPLQVVALVTVGMYAVYMVADFAFVAAVWLGLDAEERRTVRDDLWAVVFLPAFRFITYWFRVGGMLSALADAARWRVEDPVSQVRRHLRARA